jgi:hypothetical protein
VYADIYGSHVWSSTRLGAAFFWHETSRKQIAAAHKHAKVLLKPDDQRRRDTVKELAVVRAERNLSGSIENPQRMSVNN